MKKVFIKNETLENIGEMAYFRYSVHHRRLCYRFLKCVSQSRAGIKWHVISVWSLPFDILTGSQIEILGASKVFSISRRKNPRPKPLSDKFQLFDGNLFWVKISIADLSRRIFLVHFSGRNNITNLPQYAAFSSNEKGIACIQVQGSYFLCMTAAQRFEKAPFKFYRSNVLRG